MFRNGEYVAYEGDLSDEYGVLEWLTEKSTLFVSDKIEAVNKVKTVEQSLLTLEAEYSSLRQLYDR